MPGLISTAPAISFGMPRTKAITLADIEARIQSSQQAIEDSKRLLEQLRTARGTRDFTYKHQELFDQMRTMLQDRPMRFREILETTKAEENHIKAVIVRMQREEIGLVNLGDQARAVWWLPDQEVLKRLIK